jgi:anti-sigma factor RsiW
MPLPDSDYDLISAYLDNALATHERRQVELRLTSEPELARELDALRQTISLLKSMPELTAPRDFTLSKAQARTIDAELAAEQESHRPRVITPNFRRRAVPALSAVASLVLAFVGAFSLLAPRMGNSITASVPIAMATLELTEILADNQADQDMMFAITPSVTQTYAEEESQAAQDQSAGADAMRSMTEATPSLGDSMPSAVMSVPQTLPPPSVPAPLGTPAVPGSNSNLPDDQALGMLGEATPEFFGTGGSAAADTALESQPEATQSEKTTDGAISLARLRNNTDLEQPATQLRRPPEASIRQQPTQQNLSALGAVGMLAIGLLLGIFALVSWPRRNR